MVPKGRLRLAQPPQPSPQRARRKLGTLRSASARNHSNTQRTRSLPRVRNASAALSTARVRHLRRDHSLAERRRHPAYRITSRRTLGGRYLDPELSDRSAARLGLELQRAPVAIHRAARILVPHPLRRNPSAPILHLPMRRVHARLFCARNQRGLSGDRRRVRDHVARSAPPKATYQSPALICDFRTLHRDPFLSRATAFERTVPTPLGTQNVSNIDDVLGLGARPRPRPPDRHTIDALPFTHGLEPHHRIARLGVA